MTFRIGQRVWIGYMPDDKIEGDREGGMRARCNTGTIHDGPFPPWQRFDPFPQFRIAETSYIVACDSGGYSAARQSLLYPIDDSREVDLDAILDEVSA